MKVIYMHSVNKNALENVEYPFIAVVAPDRVLSMSQI